MICEFSSEYATTNNCVKFLYSKNKYYDLYRKILHSLGKL